MCRHPEDRGVRCAAAKKEEGPFLSGIGVVLPIVRWGGRKEPSLGTILNEFAKTVNKKMKKIIINE
jgi:hypothetical protein